MSVLDIFNQDEFSLVSLTLAIETLPYQPGLLGSMGLFRQQGISELTVAIEEQGGRLQLIPTAARGTMPTYQGGRTRNLRTIRVPHIPLNDAILADEVQGVRAFGSEDATESVIQKTNDKLAMMRQGFETTWEYHRVGAIQGVVKDADGVTTIYDLFDVFDVAEINVNFNFATDDVKLKVLEVEQQLEDVLNGVPYTGITAFCGNQFFQSLITNTEVKDSFQTWLENRQQMGPTASYGGLRAGFEYGGVTWINYRGKVGAVNFLPTDTARFVVRGIPDLFMQYNAPADFIETVNTIGKPIYVKRERMKFDKGEEFHAQSNPLFLCTRPRTLIKGTRTG